MNNQPRREVPALYGAIQCDDVATTEVLLRHHASPTHPAFGNHGTDPLAEAVLDGDADLVQIFLDDDGAAPRMDDHRLAADPAIRKARHPVPTLAGVGAKAGLPATLVHRLECHAPLKAN